MKNSLAVVSKAASLGGDVHGVAIGSGVREAAGKAGAFGAAKVWVAEDAALDAPLPQPRVDVLEQLVREHGTTTCCSARACSRRTSRQVLRRGSTLD